MSRWRGSHRNLLSRPILEAAQLAVLIMGVCLSPPAFAETESTTAAAPRTSMAYRVEIDGVSESGLRTLLRQSSQLVAMQDNPPATVTGLRRRAQDDLARLSATLRSEAYYDNQVSYALNTDVTPVLVTLTVQSGPRFQLREFDISYDGLIRDDLPETIADLAGARGEPATGRFVLGLQAQVIDTLHNNGYPFAEVSDRKAQALLADAQLNVTLDVIPGPFVRFGGTDVSGLERTEAAYVLEHVTWHEGEPFNRQDLRETHTALEASGLFTSVLVEAEETPTDDGHLGVRIEATERAPRTVGVGLRYGTSEGAGARTFWEHRNLFGRAEHLRLEAEVSEIHQELSAQLRQPSFLRPDQVLVTGISTFNTMAESYDETGVSGSVGVERQLSERLMVHVGAEARVSVVDEGNVRRDTRLIHVPVGAAFDSSDDIFDPSEGARASLIVTPTIGDSETSLLYVRTELRGSVYHGVGPGDRVILAMRVRAGSIFGERNLDIPASDRFYSGGGGSVRGIGYQLAGPLDMNNEPIGGRSVFELGAEARIRVTERFGIVPFVEGGSAFTSDTLDFSTDMEWGAGIGLRYFTALGPIRLDVAVPLDPRKGVDDAVQLYISLGQAF